MRKNITDRFHAKYPRGPTTGNRRTCLAHRMAWALARGPVPDGMHACHTCDVRNCVNPEHLFLGTHQDNMTDMRTKGRSRRAPSQAYIGRSAKLTEANVREIRRMLAEGMSNAAIARSFNVARPTISNIKTRTTWAHVEVQVQ